MYEIIKSVIDSGKYYLTHMLKKIDTIWIQGDITDEQKEELKTLATANAPRDEENSELLKRLVERVETLEEKVATLENGGTKPEPPTDEYPEWTAYDGVNAGKYMTGAKVTHLDKKYVSLVDNNIWEPGVFGTETVWKEVTETSKQQ